MHSCKYSMCLCIDSVHGCCDVCTFYRSRSRWVLMFLCLFLWGLRSLLYERKLYNVYTNIKETAIKFWPQNSSWSSLSCTKRNTFSSEWTNKKAVLSQRWPRNAPYIWVPWKISGLPDYAHGYFSQNCLDFCSDGTFQKSVGEFL